MHFINLGGCILPSRTNHLGQGVGEILDNWTSCSLPPRSAIEGRFCRIEPINAEEHGASLYEAFALDGGGANWTYLGHEPFSNEEACLQWIETSCLSDDPLFHAIIDISTGKPVGVASLMRIDPLNGVIEVGNIHYSPLLQRKPAATEAMFLLMRRVFDELGYRRYEWKCDSLNAPSKRAAVRFGFRYEGLFRQAVVYKGRNRDTTWFSIIDSEWPGLRAAYEAWLDLSNFDEQQQQKTQLRDLIRAHR